MKLTLCETKIAVMASMLAMAMFNVAAAHRSEGGSCTDCHSPPGGSLTASPNPLGIQLGKSGLLTFSITSLGGSSQTAISVQGLENPAVDASIAPGGNTWTYINGDSGMSYVSNIITATGPYSLNLAIGSLATPGTYPIVVMYAGSGERETTTGFDLQVMMPGLAGDYNNDQVVNAADYTVWRNNLGAGNESSLNGNGDGLNGVDAGDYARWKAHFGESTAASATLLSSAVPEPAVLTSLVVGLLTITFWRARPRRGCS